MKSHNIYIVYFVNIIHGKSSGLCKLEMSFPCLFSKKPDQIACSYDFLAKNYFWPTYFARLEYLSF